MDSVTASDYEQKILQQDLDRYRNEISALQSKLVTEANPSKRKSLVEKLQDAKKRLNFFLVQTRQTQSTFANAFDELEKRSHPAAAVTEPCVKHLDMQATDSEDSIDSEKKNEQGSQARDSDDDGLFTDANDECLVQCCNDLDTAQYIKRVQAQNYINGEIHVIDLCDMVELIPGYKIYGPLYASLRQYQRAGVQWIVKLFSLSSGGLLADEPGVGKSVQTIAALSSLFLSGRMKYALLVVPATLQVQWLEMTWNWWPLIRCVLLNRMSKDAYYARRGGSDTRDNASFLLSLAGDIKCSQATRFSYGTIDLTVGACGTLFITSYDFVVQHAEDINAAFCILTSTAPSSKSAPIAYAVFDEAHYLKNLATKRVRALWKLRIRCKLGLSATPVQNNLVEVYSLIEFLQPSILGPYDAFLQTYDIPIRRGSLAHAKYEDLSTAAVLAQQLVGILRPYILRRLKSDVEKMLPPKHERLVFLQLTDAQEQLYLQYLEHNDAILKLKDAIVCGTEVYESVTKLTMAKLIQLQHICDHPDLLSDTCTEGEDFVGQSCKLRHLLEQLQELWPSSEDKLLIFCQGRMMLDIVEMAIQREPLFSGAWLRMDGVTPTALRPALIARFSTDPGIRLFLLTTRVGGLGLNLTAANHVFLLNPNWNPTIDDQSVERCWRIGQRKKVVVHKLFTGGTVEEKIYNRQIYKRLLMSRILDSAYNVSTKCLAHDLFQLFTYERPPDRIKIVTKEINPNNPVKTGNSLPASTSVTDVQTKEKTVKNRLDKLFDASISQIMRENQQAKRVVVSREAFVRLRIQYPQAYARIIDEACAEFCRNNGHRLMTKEATTAALSTDTPPVGLFALLGHTQTSQGDNSASNSTSEGVDEGVLKSTMKAILEIACTAQNNTIAYCDISGTIVDLEPTSQAKLLEYLFKLPAGSEVQAHTSLELQDAIIKKVILATVQKKGK